MPDTRAELLRAAAYVFAQKGYRGASTRAIAQRAQANESSIYRLFGSKPRLYWAVLEEKLEEARSFLSAQIECSPEEILAAWMRASKTDLVALRLLLFALLEGAPGRGRLLEPSLARLYAPVAAYVDALKERGTVGREVPTRAAALALASLGTSPMLFEAGGGGGCLCNSEAALPRLYAQIWLQGVGARSDAEVRSRRSERASEQAGASDAAAPVNEVPQE